MCMTPWGCPRGLLELFLELRILRGGPKLRSHLRCWPGALHDAWLKGGWGVAADPPVRLSSSSPSHGSTEEGAGGSSSSSSSSGGGKAHASIKSGLRELYRLVHPDLWTAHPVAKAENERSFKLLQEYLSLARARDADSFQAPAARVQYRFCFYMHPPTQHSAGQEQARADQAAGAAQGEQPTPLTNRGGSSSRGGGSSSDGSKGGGAKGAAAEQPARAPPPPHPAGPAPHPTHPSLTCIEVVLPPPSPRPGPPANSPYTHPSTPSQQQQQQQQQQEGGAGGEGEGGRGSTQAAGGEPDLAPSSRRALAKLLRACGIQVNNPEVGQGEGEGEGAGLGGGRAPLASFLPAAVEAQRLAQAAAQDPRLRVANVRGAMRLQRKVLVSFKEAAAVPPQQQAEALGLLAALMDSLPDLDLAGCSVLMGAPQGIDKLGNLCLELGPAAAAAAAAGGDLACLVPGWRDLLTGVDLSFVRQRKDLVLATRAMERDVARALGLASVFASSPTLVAEPSYRQFLERLAAAAQEQGQVGVAGAAAIPLCVLPAYAFHVQQQQRHPPPQQQQQDQQHQSSRGSSSAREVGWVDEATAVLCVGEQMAAQAVYDSVQQLGAKVLLAARQHSMRQQEVAELVARVRAVLRLRHLAKDEQLSLADFKAACGRLLEASAALQHVLDGASLRIAFANRVAADGSFVDIAHDFVI